MLDRLSKLRQTLTKKSQDAVLISSVPNIIYLTGFSNFLKEEREAFLLITKNKQYIITDGRYSEAVKKSLSGFELIEVSPTLSLEKILVNLGNKEKIKKITIEEDDLTVKEFKMLSKHYNNTYYYSVKELRVIKDPLEISAIEKACRLADKAFEYVLNKIKTGISEKEIAFELEFFIKNKGADISFPPIVAFGKNSAIPHHRPGNTILGPSTRCSRSGQKGQTVLFDFGAKVGTYCSDITRTVFLGKATNEQKKVYQTVLEAQKRSIDFLFSIFHHQSSDNKTVKASDVDKVARNYIISEGYPTIPHSLGHGVGLEIHEGPKLSPISKDTLISGMVFSVEPGIYLNNKFGIRIEDLVALEKTGPKILTHSPKGIIEL